VPELEKEEVDFVCLNFATAWWAIQELWVQQYKRVKLLINA
jgi:hypothetical protein